MKGVDAVELLVQAPVPIVVLEVPSHRIWIANRAWRELFAYDGPDGVPIAELAVFDDAVLAALDKASSTGTTTNVADSRCRDDQFFAATIQPVFEGAAVTAVVIVCRDVTGEAAVRRELERTSELKDQFLATVSHELRAPLTTLLLWERLLREDAHDPNARARALEAIRASAVQQARLVSDLLDVSRAISGKLRVDLAPLDLGVVLGDVIEMSSIRAAAANIVIEHRLEEELGVVGDASRLQQVFDNVLSNALAYTPPGGLIVVTAERARATGELVIEVSDTGAGIARDELAHVFEPFTQGRSTVRDRGGLGLGLAIARELLVLHGGSITAHSDGPGRGSVFTIRLPAAYSRSPMSLHHRSRPERLRDVRVLVVDDDERVTRALQLLLERAGASVECAVSAAGGWEAIERAVPDIVVSDIAMPGEDGYEFMRRLRASTNAARRVPAIALTALAAVTDWDRALAAGFDMHVAKPVDIDALVAGIATLVTTRIADHD